ncbi:conjugative transposon protein TraM [Spirosoma sordidisoli]|uniref:Conjugative transposon protein TraM n=1 Tax=Spirosoma sordidisoli TaxID=2502893 RepID=A0A4Q2UIH6_9BACT|nr:conjugative transposon protein TraM [Spirosoma sordidisoli]RYC66559.1 conjugative transposon protein TraM [Spirosoma sordidisoli]
MSKPNAARKTQPGAHLDDDALGQADTSAEQFDHEEPAASSGNDSAGEMDEVEDEFDELDEDEAENSASTQAGPASDNADQSKRKRLVIGVLLGLIAVLGIVGLLWKMTISTNGFKAPVPTEPIDVAERESNRKNQPTDYADEEQMRTMNYDGVNNIYGLALKQQQANRVPKDSIHQNTSVQRGLDRSRQLARQSGNRQNLSGSSYGNTPKRRYQTDSYGSDHSGRSSAYGDPYHANPTREDLLLRAGFNTVKAEGSGTNSYAGQQTLPPPSLASIDVEDNEPIPGVVSGDQTIMNGTRVMFRTLADAKIRDRFAPKGSILVGFAQVGSDRAIFNITTLRLSTGEAVPVRLRALDPDMNEGLALQSDKPSRQQVDQATGNAISQAAGQAAWSAGYSINQATGVPVAGNALASLGAGLASAATTGRRREVRQKLNLQDGFKVFFVPVK